MKFEYSEVTIEQAARKIQDLLARIEELTDELEWYREDKEKHRTLLNELSKRIVELAIWCIIFGKLL